MIGYITSHCKRCNKPYAHLITKPEGDLLYSKIYCKRCTLYILIKKAYDLGHEKGFQEKCNHAYLEGQQHAFRDNMSKMR